MRLRLVALGVSMVAAAVVLAAAAPADTTVAPTVTTQPDLAVVGGSGESASLAATASGTPAPTVQWQEAGDRNGPWSDIPDATSTTLTVTASSSNLGHAYRAIFTNAGGTAVTRPAKLVSTSDWMADLGSDIENVPLTELTIPGAHDMGTYGIPYRSDASRDGQASDLGCDIANTVCDSYSRAQDGRDAAQELADGIRYFDLRVCGSNDSLPTDPNPPDFVAISSNPVTCHGLVAAPLDDILSQTRAFVDAHPGEVVFLDFNHHFQVDPDTEAGQIEQAFAKPGGGSLLIPPQYCPDPDNGTCAGNLTLKTIKQRGLGNVIVNFENDGAPGSTACLYYVDSGGTPTCAASYRIQPQLDSGFYDRHPLLWGRGPSPPPTSPSGRCTMGRSLGSCFGNDSDVDAVLSFIRNTISTRQTFAEPHPAYQFQRFFVQFLQTTPDGTYIAEHPTGSLLDMAEDSNPVIVPGVFACGNVGDWCLAQYRPENVNIVAINFYNRTPLVREVLELDEYARTAPVVTISSSTRPASTGWYNAAVLGGQGQKLGVDASASDYRYPTGIPALDCTDNAAAVPLGDVQTTASSRSGDLSLGDGVHVVDCRGTDGASYGTHEQGNRGAGPGSTTPVTFKVDTTPPVITCPSGQLLLDQPVSSLTGSVTDATSGPATSTTSAPISTVSVGSFTATLTASDIAGNTTSAVCSYTVSYRVALRYDQTKQWNSGSTVPIKVELQDYYGKDVSDKSIVVTAKTVTTPSGSTIAPTSAGGTNPGFVFYVSPSKGYEYDLKTNGYTRGSYTLDFVAGRDPLTHHAPFLIR